MPVAILDVPDADRHARKRIVRTLRFLLVLAVIGAAYPAATEGRLSWHFWLAAGLLFASNITYHFERTDLFQRFRLSALLFLFDTAVLAYMMYEMGESSRDFFMMFALTILMAASGRGAGGAFLVTFVVGTLYALLSFYGKTGVTFLSVAFMTRLAFLFVLSIFVGYLASEADRARGAARMGADLYRQLFERNPAYVFLCDPGGRIIAHNRAVETAMGYRAGELLGRPLADIADLPESWRPGAAGAGPGCPVEDRELVLRRKGGEPVSAKATLAVIPSPDGPLLQLLAHEESRELRKMREAVLRAEKMSAVGQLIAGVAHELNNALTAVLGFSELLARQITEPEHLRKIRLVEQEARRAVHVVGNLLVFSRRHDTQRTLFSLNKAVSDVLDLKTYDLRLRRVAVDWQPCPSLPDLVGDPQQTVQVVLNLLNNAEQALEGRGSGRLIRVRIGREGGEVFLEVSDNGPGILPEILPRLFDPFVTTKAQGTGLGLSVSRSIVREHGGDITVRSEPGQGATFRVMLPAPPGETAVIRPGIETTWKMGLEGLRFLVVDDEAGVRESVSEMLRTAGGHVEDISGEPDLVETLAAGNHDAVLCDMQMPGINGREIHARLRARLPGAEQRLIFITGDMLSPDTRKFIEESGCLFLEKPFDAKQLVAVVSEQVRRSREDATPSARATQAGSVTRP